jgi:hypothetical protein
MNVGVVNRIKSKATEKTAGGIRQEIDGRYVVFPGECQCCFAEPMPKASPLLRRPDSQGAQQRRPMVEFQADTSDDSTIATSKQRCCKMLGKACILQAYFCKKIPEIGLIRTMSRFDNDVINSRG